MSTEQMTYESASGTLTASCNLFAALLDLPFGRVGYRIFPNTAPDTHVGSPRSGHFVTFHVLPSDGSLFETTVGGYRVSYAFPVNNLASHDNLMLVTNFEVGHFFDVPQNSQEHSDRLAGALLISAWNLADAVAKKPAAFLLELPWGFPHQRYLVETYKIKYMHMCEGGYTLYSV